ncbi:GreA/GreB family elongation factor [Sphingomonas sp.]|uniref:GreA/GreB family elongation factor n=1 Tax=Sphingomonas sp. TaxID=28214 RepID=UPI003B00D3A3
MSVAFRRESDEEHLEPKFELPIPAGPNPVTGRGKRLIDAKVAGLEAAIAGEGDAERLTALRRELRYWHTRQTTAEVAPAPAAGQIGIGARVTFRLNGGARTLTIVGADEADPAAGLIGFAAPLAQALIGAEAGERVDFGGRTDAIEIVEVGDGEG